MSDNEIPPPQIPGLRPPDAESIYIPYMLADAPRLQLDFLTRNSLIPETNRASIRKWLDGYNARLSAWIQETYGVEGVQAADALSRATGKRMGELLEQLLEKRERDLFAALEKELGEDE